MKKFFLSSIALFAVSSTALAVNSMLKSPVTGYITSTMMKLSIATDGKDVVLLVGAVYGVYAIDIQDTATADAAANLVTTVPDFVASKLNTLAGEPVYVRDMVVNPKSKSVYILASGSESEMDYLFKETKNGAKVEMLDLSKQTFCKIECMNPDLITMDVSYGDGKLYASFFDWGAGSQGYVAEMKAPFSHNSTFTPRATSLFNSIETGSYNPSVTMERFTYANIKGVKRLCGVSVGSPGFSVETSKLVGTDVLEVSEDFNLVNGRPNDVVTQYHDGKAWLYDLHTVFPGTSKLYRIGQSFLDGSPVSTGKFNNTSVKLLDSKFDVSPGLADSQIKQITGDFISIAFWDNNHLLVQEGVGGPLRLITTGVASGTGISESVVNDIDIAVYPNPASKSFTIRAPKEFRSGSLSIYTQSGSLVNQQMIDKAEAEINISNLPAGNYYISLTDQLTGAKGVQQLQVR